MGLDITAYKKLKIVENSILDEDGNPVNWETEWKPGVSMEWSEQHFPGRGEGIDPNTVYTWEDEFGFRAGSYTGYNWWRNKLEEISDGESFQELINFADNEGVIGYVVSKKLAKDFTENEERAVEFAKKLDESEWWLNQYRNWKRAFEIASENGAVDFH
jgi:hypothetical protein